MENTNPTDHLPAEHIDRREMLRRVAVLFGGTLSAPAMLGVMSGISASARAEAAAGANGALLNSDQLKLIADIADILIPRTDTPGAVDVGVPAFIDTLLDSVYPVEQQQRYLQGLAEFAAGAFERHGQPFPELENTTRVGLVREALARALTSDNGAPPAWEHRPFILMTKELTLLGFFTSEIGATRVLQYDAVPGAYEACLPLAETGNGRTWASDVSLPF